jgi:hypothetical protein
MMQFVIRRMSARSSAGTVRCPADPENLRLAVHRSGRSSLCTRQKSGFPERSRQKISCQHQLPNIGVQRFTSIAGRFEPGFVSAPKSRAAPLRKLRSPLQVVIWFGCISNCSARSASIFSPLIAAKATFDLKAGLWFRRGLFIMLAPVHGSLRRAQAEFPLIQVVIGMCRRDTPIRVSWSRRIDYRRATRDWGIVSTYYGQAAVLSSSSYLAAPFDLPGCAASADP